MKKVTALAQWFGSNRSLAANVGAALEGCEWVGIPFAGGMCEVPHITARTIAINDRHRHVINLARVVADTKLGPQLIRRLRRASYDPDRLGLAQRFCANSIPSRLGDVLLAEEYFITIWMSRAGDAGTDKEFSGTYSFRWDAGGGDSVKRFRSATEALLEFRASLQRCTFQTMNALNFITKCKDKHGHGIYCDPPFPGPGDAYKCKFDRHREMSALLSEFKETRIVLRYYDTPLIRELHPESGGWKWHYFTGRDQTNNDTKPEVLIVRN
jgi:hypothetical protein